MKISSVNSTAFKGLLEVNGVYHNTDEISGIESGPVKYTSKGNMTSGDVRIVFNKNSAYGLVNTKLKLDTLLDAYKEAAASKDAIVKTSYMV